MAGLTGDPFRAARLLLALRREGVTDSHLLTRMESTDRSDFAGEEHAGLAFEDCYLPIACGQAVLPPLAVGQILQAGGLRPGETGPVLLVGGGSGYMAALAAPLCERLVVAERYRQLAREAGSRLEKAGISNAVMRHGDGLEGLAEEGPYERILLAGSVEEVPGALIAALAPGGRLIAPQAGDEPAKLRIIGDGGETIAVRSLCRDLPALRPGLSTVL
ncbi:MAG: protein-L-isoaspartate O-methyltransferase [Alphaproteobacteria bacterium]|jgi:protein-L-isoaspartate(D-aspartate) O-methyltransferase|nr:protein-L-isoaspartate O-methyltransferase [Alphaproteobacteria bacterium]